MEKTVRLKDLILMEKELIEDKMRVLHGVTVKGWRIRRIDRQGRGYLEARKGKKSIYLGRCKSLIECEEMITRKEKEFNYVPTKEKEEWAEFYNYVPTKEEEEMLKKWVEGFFKHILGN